MLKMMRHSANGALFIREDAVEAAWAVVNPVLDSHPRGGWLLAQPDTGKGGNVTTAKETS